MRPCPNWPNSLRYLIGGFIAIFAIVFSPLLALMAVRYSEIFKSFGSAFKEWLDTTGMICIVAVQHNNWFKK